MTYGNRNPNPKHRPRDEGEDGPFRTVRFEDPHTFNERITIHRFTVSFSAADFKDDPNVRGPREIMRTLAEAINNVGYTLQARELREAAREFADERN